MDALAAPISGGRLADMSLAPVVGGEGDVLVSDDADLLGGDIPGLAVENWA